MSKSYLIDMDGVIVRGSELVPGRGRPFSIGCGSAISSF